MQGSAILLFLRVTRMARHPKCTIPLLAFAKKVSEFSVSLRTALSGTRSVYKVRLFAQAQLLRTYATTVASDTSLWSSDCKLAPKQKASSHKLSTDHYQQKPGSQLWTAVEVCSLLSWPVVQKLNGFFEGSCGQRNLPPEQRLSIANHPTYGTDLKLKRNLDCNQA